jgi:hypothetical protein
VIFRRAAGVFAKTHKNKPRCDSSFSNAIGSSCIGPHCKASSIRVADFRLSFRRNIAQHEKGDIICLPGNSIILEKKKWPNRFIEKYFQYFFSRFIFFKLQETI